MTQSKTSVPVITKSPQLVLDNVELSDFCNNESFNFSVTDRTKIVSFAYKIPIAVDPLAVLQKFSQPDTVHFYWENPSKQEAVAAWGVTKSTNAHSESRFAIAQNFIKNCFRQIIRKGEQNLAASKPCVFCSFSFFAESQQSHSFPAATVFLPRFQVVKKNKTCLIIVNLPLTENQKEKVIVQQIEKYLREIDWTCLEKLETRSNVPLSQSKERGFSALSQSQTENSHYFKSVVTSALSSIAVDEFSKVVIAHTTDIKSPVPYQVVESLDNLRQLHPDCYIFAISNGRRQHFIGASPERLVSVQNRQLVTDALAGSAPRAKTTAEDLHLANLLLKSRKEKREHQAVSDFIMQRLRQLGLKPQQLPLQLLKLSNIQHLWTPIYAHLPADIEPLEIVAQLHPTPAVAGVPTELACEKIRHYEQFDRSLYGAPLGWVDQGGNCEFIVGIRSAFIDGDLARLYAGAGIVSGSNPAKEFAEVQLKLESLLKALV
ncbi:MAG: isochorismate synthase [Pleurocapsa sp.]